MNREKELQFMAYWENSRESESAFSSKLLRGMPMAILFTAPILLSVAAVYIYSPDWYAKISAQVAGSIPVTMIALVITMLFISYFRMHFKWEQNEQLYLELKHKYRNDAAI